VNKMKISLILGFLGVFALVIMSMGSVAYDWSAAEYCSSAAIGCHPSQQEIVSEWKTSSHANSYDEPFHGQNTYCAKCHSPFQADPAATYGSNDPVPSEEWEGVTCQSCHPPRSLRTEWGTPFGNFDVATQTFSPVYEEAIDDLCTHCHSGSRHSPEF
jgi:hypothetical protein